MTKTERTGKKAKGVRFVSFFVFCCFCLSLLACGGSGGEALPTQEKGVEKMILIQDGTPLCAIKGDEKSRQFLDTAIENLTETLSSRYACTFPASSEKEIRFVLEGSATEWSVEAAKEGVRITGGSKLAAARAAEEFLRVCTFGAGNTLSVPVDLSLSGKEADRLDNSSFLSYLPSGSAALIDSNGKGNLMTPEWAESLVMTEVRILTASKGKRLQHAVKLIDHYAETGVNCLYLTPVYDYGETGNGYGNTGPHRIGQNITGTPDQKEGWAELKKFVDYAHEKGVYILLDIITWGVENGSELTLSHPDWFSGEAWGGAAFDWSNQELREWFVSVAVENILKTGADGYRCDCEPNYSGYDLYAEVRERLAKEGKHVLILSEDGSDRSKAYDFEQDGVLWYEKRTRASVYEDPTVWYVDGGLEIVQSVKTGTGIGSEALQKAGLGGRARYYTNCITNHDYQKRIVCGNRLNIGYAAVTAPFIPLWYMGDEFNCSWQNAVQYDLPVNFSETDLLPNRLFFEDVKKMIAVRRSYPEIFEVWPEDHRDSNICAVPLEGARSLSAYARYAGNKAILIVPNNDAELSPYLSFTVPFEACGIEGFSSYRVTDLWSGVEMAEGGRDRIEHLESFVPYQNFTLLLVEGI